MPITVFEHSAIWRYNPTEIIDDIVSRFINIKSLEIHTSSLNLYHDEIALVSALAPPYILPSIAAIFPNLNELRIGTSSVFHINERCFIGGLTDVPETIQDIIIDNSYISDLSPILRGGRNLESISISYNNMPILLSMPLPFTLKKFMIRSVVIEDPIIFLENITSVTCEDCQFSRIYGLERAPEDLYCYIRRCMTSYDNRYLVNRDINEIVSHITEVNAQSIYLELGLIPKSIKITKDIVENPIMIVLKALQSNYPRRMAEFVAVTEVSTKFLPPPKILGWPYENWGVSGVFDTDED